MKKFQLKKLAMALVVIMFGFQAFAQGRIDLAPRGVKSTEAQNVTMSGFTANFSFNSIESQLVSTEKGEFSMITLDNSVAGGNIGDPQVPVNRELIAVPFGANPVVKVTGYTVEEYNLADYGIERIYPQQPSVSKSEKDPKFAYNEAAYAAKGYNEDLPLAMVTVMGTMRGIQIGALQINAVRYDASANTIRVYNDINVEVTFEDADLALTEQTLVNTYSPYFRPVYATLFNERAILDVYDDHPDLWAVPVKVLVIANRMFETTLEPWITWKTEKGFYMDVNYTDDIGTSASAIKTFITNKYNEGVAEGQAPTFLIIVGDNAQVPASQTGSASHCVTDLYYYAVAGGSNDYFGDMFHSRFTCENTTELQTVIGKSLMYEQYTMPDPTYLNNTLLIAGWDSSWNPRIGKPTIQYATNYYYNAEHGFNVYEFLQQPYNQPYASLNTGVAFVNYTAHGSNTSWSDPYLSNSDVSSLTNADKYFLAMGNCCQAADWGISGKCFGETMITAQNKGAYAYIGSCPSSYWYEDYYFGVGATNVMNQMPPIDQTTMGVYDATFRDDFNTISAIPFVGNLAVAYGHANGYEGSVSDQYYWESYHVLGDGSICNYHINPEANNVSHLPTLPIGMDFYTVSAEPGSYVGISKDGVLYGAGEIGEEGVADIPMTPVTSGGTAKIVVSHPQRQPYVAEVPAAAMTGAYVAVDTYEMSVPQANYGETVDMNITVKNVGTQSASNITATLSTECEYVTVTAATASIASLAPDQTATMQGFQFEVADNAPDKLKAQFVLSVTDGTDVWDGNITITLHAPVLAFEAIGQSDEDVTFTFKNTGTAPFYGGILSITSCSSELVFDPATITVDDVVEGGQTLAITSAYTVDPSVEIGTTFEVAYDFTTGLFEIEDIFVLSYGAIMEDFESGDWGDNWTQSAQYAWNITDGGPRGTKCAVSTNNGMSNSEGYCVLTVDVLAPGELTFWYKVSSESNYDKLHFYMDNQEKGTWSGTVAWTEFTQQVTVGQHTFKWSYTKDSSVNTGDDCAWIDDIKFPPTNVITFIAPATDLVAELDGHDVRLTWTASADAVEYVVKRDGEVIATVATTEAADYLEESGIYKYSVYAVSASGSMSEPVSAFVEADFAGVEEAMEMTVSVYPNPSNGVLNIVTNANNYEYQMINCVGQVVVSGNANGRTSLNVGELSGVYFLRIVANGETVVRKVTVK